MEKIKIGFAPTRRKIFSAPDAVKYADLIRNQLTELGIDFVDIQEINEDGLLYDDEGTRMVGEKFISEKVDGLFIPHCNFGTEYECAKLAQELNVPVLLWGPRDERPESDGSRLRDSQCGLFATGKVLRRFQVPFTYMNNCRIEDPEFERGIKDFLKVCNVVKVFRQTKILQIGPRPFDFWSVMVNEGELLEKFNIQLAPVSLGELYKEINKVREEMASKVTEVINFLRENTVVSITDEQLERISSLKIALSNLGDQYGCNAGVLQCWDDFQEELGITPYAAEAILQDEGFPVLCETDIHGAITTLLLDAASGGEKKSMFADFTVRHPDNENGELLQHLGVFPFSTADGKPELIPTHFVFDYPGSVGMEAKKGELTLCRFDGDNGEYSMLLGNAKGIEGPYNQGSYLWMEVDNWKRLESKLVYGPYIHHCSAIHGDVVPILYEACKYIGVTPDFYDPIEGDVKAYLRGE